MKKKCIITIPIHKDNPKQIEIESFKRALKILHNHDIAIFTYEELNINIYKELALEFNKKLSIVFFNKAYFTNSIYGYNQLMLSKEFYSRFYDYEYLLIYQLDAWVFKDELDYWCNKGYDYIGAPLFEYKIKQGKIQFSKNILGIGNGGFSLRKINYCLKLLNKPQWLPILKPSFLWKTGVIYIEKHNLLSYLMVMLKVFIMSFGYNNSIRQFIKKGNMNEDYFFSIYTYYSWNKQKTNFPSVQEASHFAFEVNPSYLYSLNKSLPFGCHAFEKWEFESFWKKHLDFKV